LGHHSAKHLSLVVLNIQNVTFLLLKSLLSEFDFNISQASRISEKGCNVLQGGGEIGIDLSSFGKEKVELESK